MPKKTKTLEEEKQALIEKQQAQIEKNRVERQTRTFGNRADLEIRNAKLIAQAQDKYEALKLAKQAQMEAEIAALQNRTPVEIPQNTPYQTTTPSEKTQPQAQEQVKNQEIPSLEELQQKVKKEEAAQQQPEILGLKYGVPKSALQEVKEKGFIGTLKAEGERFVESSLTNIARIWDFLKSSFQASKNTDVKIAEAAFADSSAIIQKSIEQVKLGLKSPLEAQRELEYALKSINDLERTTHGLSKYNLRYFLSGGKETEAQILREMAILESQRLDLIQAKQAYDIAQIKAKYGQ